MLYAIAFNTSLDFLMHNAPGLLRDQAHLTESIVRASLNFFFRDLVCIMACEVLYYVEQAAFFTIFSKVLIKIAICSSDA